VAEPHEMFEDNSPCPRTGPLKCHLVILVEQLVEQSVEQRSLIDQIQSNDFGRLSVVSGHLIFPVGKDRGRACPKVGENISPKRDFQGFFSPSTGHQACF